MARLTKEFKEAVASIPLKDLHKLVIKAASKDESFRYLIDLEYISGKTAEAEFFEETKDKIMEELSKPYRYRIPQKSITDAMGKAVSHINHFVKVAKNKPLEAKLLLILLNEVFSKNADHLGSFMTAFDSKLAITTNRLYNLVTKKLHEDYKMDYAESINGFLKILHQKSKHLDYVYNMPKSME